MREDGGRPSPGMRPRVLDGSGNEVSPALTVLMIPKEPANPMQRMLTPPPPTPLGK